MSGGLTELQARCLTFIRAYIERTGGVSPSLDEIAQHLGLASRSGVPRILVLLRDRGLITWTTQKTRSIRLVPTLDEFTTWLEGLSADEFANAEAAMKDVGFRRRRDRTLGLNGVRI